MLLEAKDFMPGIYRLVRKTDKTGISGTGVVALVIIEQEAAIVKWITGKKSVVLWVKVQDMLDVHLNCHPDTGYLEQVGDQFWEHEVEMDVREDIMNILNKFKHLFIFKIV